MKPFSSKQGAAAWLTAMASGPCVVTIQLKDETPRNAYIKTAQGWRIKSRTQGRDKAWHNPLLQTPDQN
jgi:hypothetical protein